MKIRSAELKTVCGYTSALPGADLPEIAFAGRSNVGKSSLINALMQRKRLARVGETPGKTRTINFYEIDALLERSGQTREASVQAERSGQAREAFAQENSAGNTVSSVQPEADAGQNPAASARQKEMPFQFCLVDLPGYGYANVSLDEKARWGRMIERYLAAPRDLRAVFLLLDIRHEPNANDRQMYEWILRSSHVPVLIATKADKIKRSKISGQLKIIREGLGAPKGSILLPFSAWSGSGRDRICSEISALLQNDLQLSGGTGYAGS